MFEKESNGMSEDERIDFVIALKEKMCLANGRVTDADVYFQGVKDGYNKANEWHYPSKGEFPECDENTLLTIYVTCYYEVGGSLVTRNRTVLGYYQKSFMNDDVKVFVEKSKGYSDEHLPKDVIAWKEIVLPKLPKEM